MTNPKLLATFGKPFKFQVAAFRLRLADLADAAHKRIKRPCLRCGTVFASEGTHAAAQAAARAEWRANRRMSKLDLMLALATAGVISEASAMSAGIPAEFAPMIDAMPNPPRSELQIRWAHLVDVSRVHPFILAVQARLGWPDEQVDALFGWSA